MDQHEASGKPRIPDRLSIVALLLSAVGSSMVAMILMIMPKSGPYINWDYVLMGGVVLGLAGAALGLVKRNADQGLANTQANHG
jgi:hypothetical protein